MKGTEKQIAFAKSLIEKFDTEMNGSSVYVLNNTRKIGSALKKRWTASLLRLMLEM